MSNIEKLQTIIDYKQKHEGLIAVRLFPSMIVDDEELAGNVIAMLEAPLVEDDEIF